MEYKEFAALLLNLSMMKTSTISNLLHRLGEISEQYDEAVSYMNRDLSFLSLDEPDRKDYEALDALKRIVEHKKTLKAFGEAMSRMNDKAKKDEVLRDE